MRLSLIIQLPLFAVAACSPSQTDLEAERTALMQASREWAATGATGDMDRILSYWSDDAIVLPPDQPAVVGKEAIRAFVRQSLDIPGFSITWEPEQATISGDLGYLIERNTVTFADSTGTVHTQHGKAVTIWRKNSAGEWKCVVDTWNNVPAHPVLPAPTDSPP
jgi:ketosteroid isomerase-like protein